MYLLIQFGLFKYIAGEEFWIGLRNMNKLTNIVGRPMELKVILEKASGEKAHAVYKDFQIGTEVIFDKYFIKFTCRISANSFRP